jgi:hypothetical protein
MDLPLDFARCDNVYYQSETTLPEQRVPDSRRPSVEQSAVWTCPTRVALRWKLSVVLVTVCLRLSKTVNWDKYCMDLPFDSAQGDSCVSV